jgi:YaiO family outer membrane protein
MKTLHNVCLELLQEARVKLIRRRILFWSASFAIVLVFISSTTAKAQEIEEQEVAILETSNETIDREKPRFEATLGTQSLSNGYGRWTQMNFHSAYNMNQHVLESEIALSRRFTQDSVFVGISDTYTFNDDWYGSLAVGAGDGAFYLPRYRVDAAIYKKLLTDRRLVGSIGAGYYRAPDGHTDNSLSLGMVYYFPKSWILEGGVRFNRSLPGSVQTRQQYVAATYGQDKHDLVIARYGWGKEGYLAVAANSQIVNFKSSEATLTWRHWFNPYTGMLFSATRYSNPSYRRSGVNIGLFKSY